MNLPEPFLGRLLVETITSKAEDHIKDKLKQETNVSEEFLKKFQLGPEIKGRTPITRGKIVKIAPDAFGEAFLERFGNVGYIPQIGDVVLFTNNKSEPVDPANHYHLVNDCDVNGYFKAEQTVNTVNEV